MEETKHETTSYDSKLSFIAKVRPSKDARPGCASAGAAKVLDNYAGRILFGGDYLQQTDPNRRPATATRHQAKVGESLFHK
ncbi:hypothetical protein OFB51_26340, partial [Escherichia coli]|nr:hypothetical protein [Escherichia coli]